MFLTRWIVPILMPAMLYSCGSGGVVDKTVKHHTIYSSPAVCSYPVGGMVFCLNNKNPNKAIEFGGLQSIPGFEPEWGTQYEITVLTGRILNPPQDGSSLSQELISIDSVSPDPIGTTYTLNVGSTDGGFQVRSNDSNGYYTVLGYSVICEIAECESVGNRFSKGTFELVEVDGKRQVKLIALD